MGNSHDPQAMALKKVINGIPAASYKTDTGKNLFANVYGHIYVCVCSHKLKGVTLVLKNRARRKGKRKIMNN